MAIQHRLNCKVTTEPQRRVVIFTKRNRDVVATCIDCGMYERYPPTKFDDIKRPECEARSFTMAEVYSRVGRTLMEMTCPFCGNHVNAFLWSISGGGKRCECGAILSGRGMAYKLKVTS